jgi:hypothetical protein
VTPVFGIAVPGATACGSRTKRMSVSGEFGATPAT